MIELPEAYVISRQMAEHVAGRTISDAVFGQTPHKFAFANHEPDAYAEILIGEELGKASPHGNAIIAPIGKTWLLVLGGGGERILFHADSTTLPKKHQFLLKFTDETSLSVTVQGWGNVLLLRPKNLATHPYLGEPQPSPLDESYTLAHFQTLFDSLDPAGRTSVKYFAISDPKIWGIGNGCLQDILFHARIHPKRPATGLSPDERRALWTAATTVSRQIADAGGRETERDLFGSPGGYKRILHSKSVGTPCPNCGSTIERFQYLGGACVVCPGCQR